jgi:hypothetical protein
VIHEILRWAASIGTIGAGLILGGAGPATHHRLGFRRADRSIHDLDRHRLSHR